MANEKRPTFISLDDDDNALHGVVQTQQYNSFNCTVYFNGEKRTDCVSADEVRGYVDVFAGAKLRSEWRCAADTKLHRLFGAVQLEFEA